MQLTIEMPAQRIADLMITGIAGGIGYWAKDVEVQDEIGRRLSYAEAESYEGLFWVKGRDAETGMPWEFSSVDFAARVPLAPRHLADWLAENEDVETADALIQCAAFGEIMFG